MTVALQLVPTFSCNFMHIYELRKQIFLNLAFSVYSHMRTPVFR